MIASRLGTDPEVRLLGDLASGVLSVEPIHPAEWLRIAELVSKYRSLPLGTVDASVIATAERLWITTVATLDRRRFGVVRPDPTAGFTMLP